MQVVLDWKLHSKQVLTIEAPNSSEHNMHLLSQSEREYEQPDVFSSSDGIIIHSITCFLFFNSLSV